MPEIKKVCVIGAGVMGAGIAAQIANSGAEVLLLDIVPKGLKKGDDRSVIAKTALAKFRKAKPAPLMHKSFMRRITPGNIDDDLGKISGCDWVIEAVIERLDIKRDLYKKIERHRKKTAIISSNTSTIPLEDLTKGFSDNFKKHFLITHFFNPPRYMRLLEIVTSKATDKKVEEKIRQFGDERLGKSLVDCNDTPGFIANRIGTFWLHCAVVTALEQNMDVEAADAVLGRPAGVPKTGVFGLLDLVGLDLVPHLLSSLQDTLDKKDPFQDLGPAPKLLNKLIKDGYTGRKGKGGFYRLKPNDKNKTKQVLDLKTLEYADAKRPKPAAMKASKKSGLKALVTHDSPEGKYAWTVLSHTLAYAVALVPEIAGNPELVDRAMKLGYNWKTGPFELIDKLGTGWFAERLKAEGRPVPPLLEKAAGRPFYMVKEGKLHVLNVQGKYQKVQRPKGVLLLEDVKRASQPIWKNMSACVWDVGDGVACLEFTSKMNSFDPFIMWMIQKCIKRLPSKGFKALVIHNEGTNFSVGANIGLFKFAAKLGLAWYFIPWILRLGQGTFQKLKYAPFPVVGAPSGMALGGGCEVLLHCHHITAHAETYIGLVEAGVGLIPGWGGCKEMLGRWATNPKAPKGPMVATGKAFELIGTAHVATSAFEAQEGQFFRHDDTVVMNRDRLLATAKAKALEMAKIYKKNGNPTEPFMFRLAGPSAAAALKLAVRDFEKKGVATPHDVTIAHALAEVLSGGKTDGTKELTETELLKLERVEFVRLSKTKETYDRVNHMLTKGKPLRN